MKPFPLFLTMTTIGVAVGAGVWVYFNPINQQAETPSQVPGSTLDNVTLTEFDSQGNLIWEIKASKADYSQDNLTAQIVTVSGKFYRGGKVLIEAQGKAGSVNQKERKITIDGDIKAKLLNENIQVNADRMVWQADDDLLTATGNIKINQPDRQISLVGKSLKAIPSISRFTLEQAVKITSAQPPIVVETPALTWEAPKGIVRIDVPFKATHQTEDLTLNAQKGVWQIPEQVIKLPQSAVIKAPQRDWQVGSRNLEWRIAENLLNLPQAVEVASKSRGYVLTSQSAKINLTNQIVQLLGNVRGTSSKDQSQITADRAEWNIPQQLVTAQGNVFYRQAEGNLDVKGDRAIANLADQTVAVSSPNSVETLVIPE
ncbi:MAG: LPS export ABC transporter periplasmic protein LptC [Cyanobacteria bacterium KgW148]|nr:LPS export ABC transporter periplasmic protein LptC [Cyanobacteria bacterium KgW148]